MNQTSIFSARKNKTFQIWEVRYVQLSMFVLSWTVSNVSIHIVSSPSNVAQVFTARRESLRSRLYQQLAWNMTLRGGQALLNTSNTFKSSTLPSYRRGHPRSRFMPLPADKQIAQNTHHSWGLSAYYSPKCIYTPKIQNLLITVEFSTEVIICYRADFIGLRLCPGIYWATPWNLSGSMKASTSVNRHVPSSSISEWDARAFVLFSQVHIFSWHPKKWDLTPAKKISTKKRHTHTHLYIFMYVCV